MSLDTTNMLFSLVFLAQRKVPRAKAVAASVGAGMIPGAVGLVLPAIVARGTGPVGKPPGPPPPVDTGEVKVTVPGVVGETEADGVSRVRDAHLTPVLSTFPTDDQKKLGRVVGQEPEADTLRRQGSDVDLTIGRAPEEEEESESEKEDRILEIVHRIEDKVDECVDTVAGQKARDRGPSQSLVGQSGRSGSTSSASQTDKGKS
jgi:hypothetical protein